jgi:protein TonB
MCPIKSNYKPVKHFIMEIKKSKKANLESRRRSYFLFGLIVSLSLSWMAFEYRVYEGPEHYDFGNMAMEEETDVIVQTMRPEEIKPPKPKPVTIFEVTNKTDIPDIEINVEIGADEPMENYALIEDEPVEEVEPVIFVPIENMPEFPGGEEALMRYLSTVKYPRMAVETGIQGTVYVGFVVEKDGSISHIEVKRGISEECDAEAVRAIKAMPKWKPGMQRNKPVRVYYTLPIRYVLIE